MRTSELHSRDMIVRDYFSHTTPDGVSPWTRAQEQGYSRARGENISYRWTWQDDLTPAVHGSHDGLFRSAGHRENLMREHSAEIGIGIETGSETGVTYQGFSSPGASPVLTTQMFGASGENHAITGVAYTDTIDTDGFYSVGEGLGNVRVEATNEAGETYQTVTSDAGGYALRVPAGSYSVVFVNEALQQQANLGTVSISSQNVKVDVLDEYWNRDRQILRCQ